VTGVVAVVQARMSSTRLFGKVMAEIAGRPAIWWTLTRVRRAAGLDAVWLACSDMAADDELADFARELGVPVFRGDENDVLSRFAAVAAETSAQAMVRLTGDCPLADPDVIGRAVAKYAAGGADYVSNHLVRSYPDGLDVEVFSRAALERAHAEAKHAFLRQHVTPYIHGRLKDRLPWGGFKTAQIVHEVDFSHLRWTLDEPEDLAFLRRLLPQLPAEFHWLEAVAAMTRDPDLFWINRRHKPNEGAMRDLAKGAVNGRRFDRSNQLFARAIERIPLGSQTFSKSHQQWVRGASPLFIQAGAGCRITDPDGNVFIDYLQGLMANVLGYGDPDVDAAIRAQLRDGMSFSLASTIEADLADRLARDIPCAEMVRYGKNGSDATSAAIRLARAHTGRDKVALCGYHGWHDWYIGSTSRHLGVPAAVRALSATFPFNDADALAAMLAREPDMYAAVILEPAGATAPVPGFLARLRALTERYGVVLIFDEIVSGFRMHRGGAQAFYGVTPDLAAFGKAMANGMPISAVVGRRGIMSRMDDIFFSGTFGGEALSIAAAIATIDKLARENAVERLWRRGDALIAASNRLFEKHGLAGVLRFAGDGWWPRLFITNPPVERQLMNSLLRQEFVAAGLLLAASYNLCLPHDSEAVMQETLAAFDAALGAVRGHLDAPDPAARLKGALVQPTFSVRKTA